MLFSNFPVSRRLWYLVMPAVLTLFLHGCAAHQPPLPISAIKGPAAECRDKLSEFDRLVLSEGAADTQASRIPGYPCFRANRFLQSFKAGQYGPKEIAEWLERAKKRGDAGRRAELANLPSEVYHNHYPFTSKARLGRQLDACADHLLAHFSENPARGRHLIAAARVPDDYSSLARVLGVYPVTRLVVLYRLSGHQEETREAFQELPEEGPAGTVFAPAGTRPDLPPKTRARMLEKAAGSSALGIPEPGPDALEKLFDYFAPAWHVRPWPESDRIGRPFWQDPAQIGVDTADPVTYRFHSFTRLDSSILLQLNYVIWFPSRPPAGFLDIYSGRLDGIMWRVTLGADGRAALYDSIHCCGCFHKYYPVSSGLTPRPEPDTGEPPMILSKNIPDNESARVLLHLSRRTHYVTGLAPLAQRPHNAETYRMAPYRALRRLPLEKGSRSMFTPDGIVPGTERLERFLLWPMGVPSAGAMRQRGHHPVTLVGRQYFDEARLLERVFTWKSTR